MKIRTDNTVDVSFLVKFTLYETKTKFFIVGEDYSGTSFQVLKIDRTVEDELDLMEDETIYSKNEISKLLITINEGNRNCGGISKVLVAWGICGFIRFTCGYYISFITKRSTVALLGGHYIYHINDTKLVPIAHSSILSKKPRSVLIEESRYLNIFQTLDLNKTFYFSYSYDITHTLQHNLTTHSCLKARTLEDYNEMFVWNYNLLNVAIKCLKNGSKWCIPIIHGFIDQANISVYGKSIYVTLIARRSRHFAGARFFKRGVNSKGYVANDVESEQIVSEMSTTSFYTKDMKLNPKYTSYVQHRGSIPLFWSQDPNNMSPKPPIKLDIIDPFFSATALHFDNMFKRYKTPCIVVNLIKSRERVRRESILLEEYTQAIYYLNQFLPEDKKIKYIAWDMSRASKTRGQDVILTLENIADEVLKTTGFFHSKILNDQSENIKKKLKSQEGICRTNCIDCLDRTNAAQFVIAKKALGYQLFALGVIKEPILNYDTDAINLLTEMYHDHGDTIALQYGGSHLVNTMSTYRKINHWTSHSRDIIESIRRFYTNSFVDAQRQSAINLFLGIKLPSNKHMLWDLTTNYDSHHTPQLNNIRRNYKYWYIPINIDSSLDKDCLSEKLNCDKCTDSDEYWSEYYKPKMLSTLEKMFAYKINSTLRYMPLKYSSPKYFEFSPFMIRSLHRDVLEEESSRNKPSNRDNLSYKKHKRQFAIQKILRKVDDKKTTRDTHEYNKVQKMERFHGLDAKNGPFLFPLPSQYVEINHFSTSSMMYKKEEYKNYLYRSYHIELLQEDLSSRKLEYNQWISLSDITYIDKVKPNDKDLDLYIEHCEFPETLYPMKGTYSLNKEIIQQVKYQQWLT
ncbi:hypothetical protein T552_02303 [Pneumocystis carinii B80]|uniref:SAC domain-containing protein n=1 Tax=Pneumocystis carinii (strain B80) TaxID=1408658 RepID=A0A0W4ZG19_PNEC8|nr:hypothetical protein T552_02303 [Pneumocystis carinii B80]KTW27319.1 hypothetical protein T552_02303 [Pneumocystis carinii B80]